ncbi:MAG: BON domain-containing protein [Gammaproteobacteria bacterium]
MKTTIENKQNILVHRVLVMLSLSAVLGVAGCEQEGTAEQAGKKIDRAAEKAEQKIEAAKESLDQKAEKAGEFIEESTDASKGTLEKAAKKIDQATEKAENELEGAKESVTDKAQTAGEYIDDSMITLKVKAELLNDPFLKASQIEVTTVNGEVTLNGTVDSEQSLGRAVEVAKSQQNVKSVQSNLIVNTSSQSN